MKTVNLEIIDRLGCENSNTIFSLGLIYQFIKFLFHILIALIFNLHR